MNLYVLVEGKRTEIHIYPEWFSTLLPKHSKIGAIEEATYNNYYLISGFGYPCILTDHLPAAIEECNETSKFRYLVVVLDSEEDDVHEKINEVANAANTHGLRGSLLQVVVQNRSIETWCLGNRRVLTRAPQDRLREFVDFFDVGTNCPESMGKHHEFNTHAQFHHAYLCHMLRAANMNYSKKNPRSVAERTYLEHLINRANQCPGQLPTFSNLLRFCKYVTENS